MTIHAQFARIALLFIASVTAAQSLEPQTNAAIAPPSAAASAPGVQSIESAKGTPAGLSDEPVDIASDAAHVNENAHIVVLTGHVVAKQGAVTLQADTVTVHYLAGATTRDSHSKIDRLDASGNVIVTRPGEVVKGDLAVYKLIDGQILMTGHVIATRGGNVVRGDNLTVDLVKDMIKLQADPQSGRVRAIFTPPSSDSRP